MNAAYLTPAITLFNEDGTLDLASQERLFNNLIDQGAVSYTHLTLPTIA